MKRKQRQNTVLEACSEEVQQSSKRGISRRQFVQASAGVVAAGALLGKRAFAAPKPLKIGYVSPETGDFAPFGESDAFVVGEIRKLVQGGIQSGGTTRQVELLVRDSQSSPNRAAEVAAQLIKSDNIDLMVSAGTPETVNPVTDQCEINQCPSVSTDDPWQSFFFGRGGKPDKGFDWTYHFFWGGEAIRQTFGEIVTLVPSNKVLGILCGNDPDGILWSGPNGAPPAFKEEGFTIVDPGRFLTNTTDFSAEISEYKKANAEVVFGNLPFPIFATFWSQAAQQGFRPKIAAISKGLLMPSAIDSLGPRGKYLSTEVWWTNHHPFKSSLTGQSAQQLCDQFEAATKKQWMQALGFRHALYEVALDVFKRAQNPDSSASVIDAVRKTRLNTIVGPVQWLGAPPNQWLKIPVKNVCTTPLVGGQWVPGKKWPYDLVVTANDAYPPIAVDRKMMPLPT